MPVRYDKLVRDRIPEVIESHGHHPVTRVLDDASNQVVLRAKLAEGPAKRKKLQLKISLTSSPIPWR